MVAEQGRAEGRVVVRNLFNIAVNQSDLQWQAFRPGVEIIRLYGDPSTGSSAALLRYAPGAGVPSHRHGGHEHIVILSGSQTDEHGVESAGTLVVNPQGSRHTITNENGCIALVIWEQPVEFDPPM